MIEERMGRNQRIVYRRIIIQGNLVLQTATHLGDGDSEGPTDMALLRDGRNLQKVLLAGSSIAGALRSYLREHLHGIGSNEQPGGLVEILFGGLKGDDDGYQSPLIINDALAKPVSYELRDGVKINSLTHTASDKAKYDIELISAGTSFPLLFELAFAYQFDPITGAYISQATQQSYEQSMLNALATALHALAIGEIGLGMKKRRGFGRCCVGQWQVWDFNLSSLADLFDWLAFDQSSQQHTSSTQRIGSDIRDLLGCNIEKQADRRHKLTLTASFALDGSLLIRSGQDQAVLGPDVVHLHAHQVDGQLRPVISGTSLAGVLRHRVERIANTLVPESGSTVAAYMFGRVGASQRKDSDPGQASRIIVHEAVIQEAITDLVQNRISIDRFTGGAFDGALFNEQPVFAKPETHVTLTIDMFGTAKEEDSTQAMPSNDMSDVEKEANSTQKTSPEQEAFVPQKLMSAMLLLLLKDLWTADLPIGGESSIGRGRLKGLLASLCKGEMTMTDLDHRHPGLLKVGDRQQLNTLIEELPTQIRALLNKEKQHEDA